MRIIEIENLRHRFADGTLGLDGVNMTIETGTLLVLAGANGSGKTTLLKHLNGLLFPETGRVLVAGKPVAEDVMRARQLVGMVFQDADSQIVSETVWDDVAFGPRNLGLERADVIGRVTAALESVGLAGMADQRPHQLSGGEKRRLAIAGVLAMQPQVLLMDEPFSNLDHPGVCQVLQQLLAVHQTGKTIIVCTHDVEKIIGYAHRLVILSSGRIVLDGEPEAILPQMEPFGVRAPCALRLGLPVTPWLN
jgi:biotin transport system ATP-binding protein